MEEDTMVAPEIIKKLPEKIVSQPGETIKLEVKATGKPKPTPKWFKSNEEILPSDDYYIENYPDGRSVLIISNAQPNEIDQISFEAVSPLGVAETVTELHVEGIWSIVFVSLYQMQYEKNAIFL